MTCTFAVGTYLSDLNLEFYNDGEGEKTFRSLEFKFLTLFPGVYHKLSDSMTFHL